MCEYISPPLSKIEHRVSNHETAGSSLGSGVTKFLRDNLSQTSILRVAAERWTSHLRIADRVGSNTIGASRCFLEQETLHSLLRACWFQERIRECFRSL
jgi:hypothetical protein